MGCGALFWRMSSPGDSILHPSASVAPALGMAPALGVGILVGVVAVGLSELLTRYTELGESLADVLAESLAGIGRADALLLALASGLAEELFFRGALQSVVGLFWASIAFGACHFLPRRELALWSVYAVGMGFALGGLYEWTGQILAPIATHVVVNGINLPRLVRRAEERSSDATDSTE
ncbi:MAG: CPBP family intramembrane metalloprotease [bacterium]|nr:hypothetical protein [Deltaproteobacteria bacterium]MCP4907935.1 CPBP family intramembrane metalloprotease [bacterium]